MKYALITLMILSQSAMANLDLSCVHMSQRKFLRVTEVNSNEVEIYDQQDNLKIGSKSYPQENAMFVKYDIESTGTSLWILSSAFRSPSNKTFIRIGVSKENIYHCIRLSK